MKLYEGLFYKSPKLSQYKKGQTFWVRYDGGEAIAVIKNLDQRKNLIGIEIGGMYPYRGNVTPEEFSNMRLE